MNSDQPAFPENDSQQRSAVRDALSREAKDSERSMWPSLRVGATIGGSLMLVMAFVPLLLSALPALRVSQMCFQLGASDIANVFSAFRTDCQSATLMARVPILSFLQLILLVVFFIWIAVLMVIALVREFKYALRFGHMHLLPMYWGYSGLVTGLGAVAAASCLVAYCLWLLMTPGFGLDTSRPIVLRTQTWLQPIYYAFDSVLFALSGAAVAVAVYFLAMTSYCAMAQLRQKLLSAD